MKYFFGNTEHKFKTYFMNSITPGQSMKQYLSFNAINDVFKYKNNLFKLFQKFLKDFIKCYNLQIMKLNITKQARSIRSEAC